MNSQRISSFSEFISSIENLSNGAELMLFRGQARKGNLLPSVAREKPHLDSTNDEKNLLQELRRMGSSILPRNDMDDWELMVVAQHFGMKTRLLDWTSNPLAALFFACNDWQSGDVYVYALKADEFLSEPKKGPFDKGETQVIKPTLNNPRIIAQHGWFTAHKYSTSNNRFVSLEKNKKIKPSFRT